MPQERQFAMHLSRILLISSKVDMLLQAQTSPRSFKRHFENNPCFAIPHLEGYPSAVLISAPWSPCSNASSPRTHVPCKPCSFPSPRVPNLGGGFSRTIPLVDLAILGMNSPWAVKTVVSEHA